MNVIMKADEMLAGLILCDSNITYSCVVKYVHRPQKPSSGKVIKLTLTESVECYQPGEIDIIPRIG